MAQGFGESRLAVPTADNVDEARNRRAQYILAAQTPVQTDWVTVSPGVETSAVATEGASRSKHGR